MRPDERFERKRTGSISSRVAPAVIKNLSPDRSRTRLSPTGAGASSVRVEAEVVDSFDARVACRSRISNAAATILSGSLRRPGPKVPQAISPASGSMM
jgi:hypothetical protein